MNRLEDIIRAIGNTILKIRRYWPNSYVKYIKTSPNKIKALILVDNIPYFLYINKKNRKIRVYSRNTATSIYIKRLIEREIELAEKKSIQETSRST